MKEIEKMKNLITKLNEYRDAYYNRQESLISDEEYDILFDELIELEKELDIVFSNSPTQNVGYEVKSVLEKIKHSHPMLSLDKTKSINDLLRFSNKQDCVLSLKMDGLTILLTYDKGKLIQAETRGNGIEGEIVTHNAKVFENIPLNIDYKGRLEIEGEAIITYDDFEKINTPLIKKAEQVATEKQLNKCEKEEYIRKNSYKNPRNLVSGSVRQLDSNIAAHRNIKFIAWKVPVDIDDIKNEFNNSYIHKLKYIKNLGFDTVPIFTYSNNTQNEVQIKKMIEELKEIAKERKFPIDGLVMTYNDINYGNSLGCTEHHPRHSLAYKFYDEEVKTILKDIDWTIGKTGVLTPTAIFEPVEIDGTTIERASVHNLSILTKLELLIGDTITVYKANQIIPQISKNLSANERHSKNIHPYITCPSICPVCGGKTKIVCENNTNILICSNDACKGKFLGKLTHFVSRNCVNIDGFSEATLEKLISLGYINKFIDIFYLHNYKKELTLIEGFGIKSVEKLLLSIEKSRNIKLENFLAALGIHDLGLSTAKVISKHFEGNIGKLIWNVGKFNWSCLEGIGELTAQKIDAFMRNNLTEIRELANEFNFILPNKKEENKNTLNGKIFVITGSLSHFINREAAKEKIEKFGGKVSNSISKKTTYLVNNDIHSLSSKNKKAKELGISIISEEDLIKMFE